MSDTQKGEKLTPSGVLERLLSYADKPWKAVVVIVLLVLAGLGWLVYDQRARIADAVLHEPITVARLEVPRFVRDADQLLRDTRSDVAVLIELHLTDNVAIDRVGFTRDGLRWVPIEGPQEALSPDGSTALLVRFLKNEVVCFDLSAAASEDSKAMFAAGYTRACLVQVPPVLGVGVGGLMIGWKSALIPAAEHRAGLVMTAAAMKFAVW